MEKTKSTSRPFNQKEGSLNHNNSELGLNADLVLNNIYTESEFHHKVVNRDMRNSSELI
jgi:hypothetical protein